MTADDIHKGLGIRRRKEQGESSTEAPSEPAGNPASGSLLGIRRRKGPQASAVAETSSSDAPPTDAKTEERSETSDEGPKEFSLGDDLTATLLRNHFKLRPELRAKLPQRLFGMHRTHGRYLGDGRESRELQVGFEPAVVLYIVPPFGYDGPPKYNKTGMVEEGLHRQPTMREASFVVDGAFNKIGDMYLYVVFQSDGQPLDLTDGRKRRPGSSSSGTSSGPLLGIKRRK